MNQELPDVQAGFQRVRGTRDQTVNISWNMEKSRAFQKNIYFCFTDYTKAFDCVDHHKLWKILKEMGTPDHLTCLLRNLFARQAATVRTRHGTMDWFHIGKGVHHGISSNTLSTWCKELTHWKRSRWCKRLKAGGEVDDRGWDAWVVSLTQGHEFEQAPKDGEGQGSLVCCSPLGRKESDMT